MKLRAFKVFSVVNPIDFFVSAVFSMLFVVTSHFF